MIIFWQCVDREHWQIGGRKSKLTQETEGDSEIFFVFVMLFEYADYEIFSELLTK